MPSPTSGSLVLSIAGQALILFATSVGAAAGQVQLIRTTSGSRGTPQGQGFVMDDPRTVFQAGKDRQVLVLFEWQGAASGHHCQGAWKDPSGRVVFTSTSDVRSRGARFGVYWGLSIPDTVATGTWVLEATVDGEPAGVHAFQILATPADPSTPAPRRALPVAEIYKRGLLATVAVETVNSAGRRLGQALGVFLSPDLVLTTFAVLNDARKVRVGTSDDKRYETAEVVSWNRRGNWAILRVPGAAGQPPDFASTRLGVGDRCYMLELQADGSRSIVEANVLGLSGTGELVISAFGGEATQGAPVFSEYGEGVGVAASDIGAIGADPLDLAAMSVRASGSLRGGRLRGFPPTPGVGAGSRTLEDLARAGEFVGPLVPTPHSVQGIMGTGVQLQGQAKIPVAADQRFQFSRTEKNCIVFITWIPAEKQDATGAFELFNEDNKSVGASDPLKLKLRPGNSLVQYWTISPSGLSPGVYRVDVKLGSDPVWRTFFRITD